MTVSRIIDGLLLIGVGAALAMNAMTEGECIRALEKAKLAVDARP